MTKIGNLARRLARIEGKLGKDRAGGPITLEDVQEARVALASLLRAACERERLGLPRLPTRSEPLSPDRESLIGLLEAGA